MTLDDAAWREPLTYALFDLGDDVAADLGVELTGAPDGFASGHPDRVGQRADGAEELNCGCAATDDEHAFAAEVLGPG